MIRRKPSVDRRDDIVKTTLELAFEHGPESVTTGMIATRLGLTQPAIYKHFPRKRDIWLEISETLRHTIAANINRAAAPELTPVARIKMLVLDQLAFVTQTPALPDIMVMRGGQQHHGMVQADMQTTMEDFRRALLGAIEAAKANHSLDSELSSSDTAALIFGIIQSQVLQMLFTRKPECLTKDGERLLDLLLSSLATKDQAQ